MSPPSSVPAPTSQLVWTAFDQAPAFIAVLQGTKHVFEYVNAAYLQLVGHRDLIGCPVREALPDVEGQGFFELLDGVLASGQPFKGDGLPLLIERTPGAAAELRYVDFVYQPLFGTDGALRGILAHGIDVTEAKAQAEALRESEARLRSLLTSMDEGYCLCEIVLGADGEPVDYRFLEVNPAFAQMTGIEANAEGRLARDLVPGLEDHWVDTYARVALGGEPLRFQSHSKALGRWFDVYAMPTGVEGRGQFMLLFSDVTASINAAEALKEMNRRLESRVEERTQELERTNEQLAARNRELQDFAHVASHDLQEPLRKIQAFAGMLSASPGVTLDEEGRHFVERMQAASERMSGLIRDLLAFSRVAAMEKAEHTVDLDTALRGALTDLEAALDETGGEVFAEGLGTVRGNPVQLQQVLLNLVGNALKYHRPGVAPLVRVRTERQGSSVRLVVEDNGIGFEARHAERIFAPFQRLHGKTEYQGTGMGLAIVRRIVDRHGGTVTASGVPGEGSRFEVMLPG